MPILGLDIGTTKICAVVIDEKTGKYIETFSCLNDTFINHSSGISTTQHVTKIKDLSFGLVNKAFFKYPDILCIGVTGQMHGILYLNDKNEPVSPLYTWQDESGNIQIPDENMTYAQKMSRITGYNMASGYGLVTHYYLYNNNLVAKDARCLTTVASYIACKLSNSDKPVLHSSDAHSLGLYDMKTHSFDKAALVNAEIDADLIPHVVNMPKVLGHYKNNVSVCIAIGDNQASVIGSGCTDTDILVNVGTGSQISLRTNTLDDTLVGIETRPLDGHNNIFTGSCLCGGRAFALLKDFYASVLETLGFDAPDDMYELMIKSAASIDKDSNDMIFSTLFCGTRNNPSLRASIENISPETFNANALTHSLLNGMVKELYDMYIQMRKIDKTPRIRLIGSGNGISKNMLLAKLFESTFEMPLYTPVFSEQAAFGAALYAAYGTNIFKNLNSAIDIIQTEKLL